MGHWGQKLGHTAQIWIILINTSGHTFDSPVMKLGQNACLGNCSDEFNGSCERSMAIMALLLKYLAHLEECSFKLGKMIGHLRQFKELI
jgi:hypothetical protein